MTELTVTFDRDTWQWHCRADEHDTRGAAGVAEAQLAPGMRAEVDAHSGDLIAITIDTDSASGAVDPAVASMTAQLLGRLPKEGQRCRIGVIPAQVIARCAIASAEASRHAALGLQSPAWAREVTALEHAMAGIGSAPPDAALHRLHDAREGFSRMPMVMGTVVERGPCLVDPSWIPSGVLALATLRAERSADGGTLELRAAISRGAYAPEVARIHAFLIDTADDTIIATAGFVPGPEGDARAGLLVGPGRPTSTIALVLSAAPTQLPSAALRMTRAATDLARRSVQARRLGLTDTADDLLAASHTRWSALGVEVDAVVPPAPLLAPLAGELDDLASLAGGR